MRLQKVSHNKMANDKGNGVHLPLKYLNYSCYCISRVSFRSKPLSSGTRTTSPMKSIAGHGWANKPIVYASCASIILLYVRNENCVHTNNDRGFSH